VRDPAGFVAGLEKARQRDIPIVVLKVGRTAESAASRSAIPARWPATMRPIRPSFDRYGVIEVDDLDGLATASFSSASRAAQGRAVSPPCTTPAAAGAGDRLGLPLTACPNARIDDATQQKLAARLEYGWSRPIAGRLGTGHDYENIFTDCCRPWSTIPTPHRGPLRGDAQRLLPA